MVKKLYKIELTDEEINYIRDCMSCGEYEGKGYNYALDWKLMERDRIEHAKYMKKLMKNEKIVANKFSLCYRINNTV